MAWTPCARAAGNVTVRVDSSGNLIVRGDGADNSITITTSAAGEGEVVGVDSTLVNGGERAPFTGVDDDFRITMRGGNDTVVIGDADGNDEVPDDLEIDTGDGDDVVMIRNAIIHDDLILLTGSGNDKVTIEQGVADVETVSDNTLIRTSSGDDEVRLEGGGETRNLVLNDFELRTSSGRDFVSISGTVFRDDVDVDLGDGDDQGEPDGPAGGLCVSNSTFEANDIMDEVEFDGGDGEDEWAIESVTGIAPPGVLDDFLDDFELEADDCSFLGGAGPEPGVPL